MIRLIVRLALAAFMANAVWRIGNAYLSYYKFTDSVNEMARFDGNLSEDQMHQRVLELAQQYDVPLTDTNFTLRREDRQVSVSGSYVKPLELFPGYEYPWPFKWDVQAIANTSPRMPPLRPR